MIWMTLYVCNTPEFFAELEWSSLPVSPLLREAS
jgi:hypothetical protein